MCIYVCIYAYIMYPVSKKIGVFLIIYLNSDNLYSLYSLTPLLSLFVSSLFPLPSHLIANPLSLLPYPPPPPPSLTLHLSYISPHSSPPSLAHSPFPLAPNPSCLFSHPPPLTLLPRPSSFLPHPSFLIPHLSFLTPHEE